MTSTPLDHTIRHALARAGITQGSRHGGIDIHAVIHDALAAAGLASNDAGVSARTAQPLDDAPPAATDPGTFTWHRRSGPGGTRQYRLYVPLTATPGVKRPLVLMLHGCQQHPDDFAAGTRMNALAERHGFVVAYPAQTKRANGSNCWNWFEPSQQRREGDEPSILAGIVDELVRHHDVDPRKVYVAGLSAGAAMAVILGQTHPEVFAAVAVHSGLPRGAARDVPTAFAAMQSRSPATRSVAERAVRTIVFHGDADATVNAANGAAVAGQAIQAFERSGMVLRREMDVTSEQGGRRCTTSTFCDELGMPLVEEWRVQGAGHAWSGGSPAGSFTDRSGPDASAEFVRFFLGPDLARPLAQEAPDALEG